MSRLVSVNVGRPAVIAERDGEQLRSAIGKRPVEGPVRVEGVNLAGDDQADRTVHGGPDKAVYAYAQEDTAWWSERLEATLGPGIFGENLTTAGVEVTDAVIGEHWTVGTVELEVCQPRQPCAKLGVRFGDLRMVKAFARAERPGAYLRIVREGDLQAGEEIVVSQRPEHGVTIAFVARALLIDPGLRAAAAQAPELPGDLLEYLRRRAAAA